MLTNSVKIMKNKKLVKLIAQAAYLNPFSEERLKIDKKIIGDNKNYSYERLVKKVVAITEKTISNLKNKNINKFSKEEKQDVIYLFLFDVYHKYREKFDELIVRQIAAGDESLKVSFANEAILLLVKYGFTEEVAVRYFSIFYQMRRAFYFIFHTLPGKSECMRKFHCDLWNNIFTHDIRLYEKILCAKLEDFSTLLLGETGTGKGTAAAAIGRSGFIPFNTRAGKFTESFMKTFIEINLSQFPETLIESELFGHKKGAFTGAVESHNGLFSLSSSYGSVFLDEIGDVSIPIQIKLLKVLQDRCFSPVGSHKKLRFDGRVIAATNKPIDKLRQEGKFRDDFFYRLCSDVITVPSLRQRIAENSLELTLLLKCTIKKIAGTENREIYDLVYNTIIKQVGKKYMWPGNVRELEQCVRRILLSKEYCGDKKVASRDLAGKIVGFINTGEYDAQGLLADYCRLLYKRLGSYQEVARKIKLDRRTVKRYVELGG